MPLVNFESSLLIFVVLIAADVVLTLVNVAMSFMCVVILALMLKAYSEVLKVLALTRSQREGKGSVGEV